MAGLLSGKVALVTGVSHEGQVGEAVARALASEGAALAIAARSLERVAARARDLASSGARVLPLAVDLTSESEVQKAVDQAASQYGRIDVLVNLAGGLTRYKPAVELTLDDWNHELGNNLLTAFLCARAAFPRLRDAGGGAIINFARAGLAQANMAAYNCAKAGVEALTRTLALEGRDYNVRVNAVAPGLVDTQSNIEAMKPKDLKKWARKEDIARAVVFLASADAAGITGQTLAVTGWGI